MPVKKDRKLVTPSSYSISFGCTLSLYRSKFSSMKAGAKSRHMRAGLFRSGSIARTAPGIPMSHVEQVCVITADDSMPLCSIAAHLEGVFATHGA
jgi:hypothetical protein